MTWRKRIGDGKEVTLTYDAENRLTGAAGDYDTTYLYDGDGKMVYWRRNDGGIQRHVGNWYESIISGGEVITVSHYYHNGTLLAQRRRKHVPPNPPVNMLRWFLTDHLGGTNVTLLSGGTYETELRYYPFGYTRYSPSAQSTNYRFTGQWMDYGPNIYFYGSRWYDPTIGRFLQADTVVPGPGNPQAFNRYTYGNNSPVKYRDPSGHYVETAWDIVNIGLDIKAIRDEGLTPGNALALIVDMTTALLPGIPAFAGVLGKGSKAAKIVARADEGADIVKVVSKEAARQTGKRLGTTVAKEVVEGAIKSDIQKAGILLAESAPETQVHHLIEKRFAGMFKVGPDDLPAIRLDKTFHQQEVTSRLFEAMPTNPGQEFTRQQIWNQYKLIYGELLGRQDWLDAIWVYFEKAGDVVK